MRENGEDGSGINIYKHISCIYCTYDIFMLLWNDISLRRSKIWCNSLCFSKNIRCFTYGIFLPKTKLSVDCHSFIWIGLLFISCFLKDRITFDVLPNFPFTTSKTMCDFYWYIRVVSRVAERRKTQDLRKLGNIRRVHKPHRIIV